MPFNSMIKPMPGNPASAPSLQPEASSLSVLSWNLFYSRREMKPFCGVGGKRGVLFRLPMQIQELKSAGPDIILLQELLNDPKALAMFKDAMNEQYHIVTDVYHARKDACRLGCLIKKSQFPDVADLVAMTYSDENTDVIQGVYIKSRNLLLMNLHVGTNAAVRELLANKGLANARQYFVTKLEEMGLQVKDAICAGDCNAFNTCVEYPRSSYVQALQKSLSTVDYQASIPSEAASFVNGAPATYSFVPAVTDYMHKGIYNEAQSLKLDEHGLAKLVQNIEVENKPLAGQVDPKRAKLVDALKLFNSAYSGHAPLDMMFYAGNSYRVGSAHIDRRAAHANLGKYLDKLNREYYPNAKDAEARAAVKHRMEFLSSALLKQFSAFKSSAPSFEHNPLSDHFKVITVFESKLKPKV